MNIPKLADRKCAASREELTLLKQSQINEMMVQLDGGWSLDESKSWLTRNFAFCGFAKASYVANVCCWLADSQGHHPDISFGWGYCNVKLTTHDAQGLTENDFIWAAKLDRLVAQAG